MSTAEREHQIDNMLGQMWPKLRLQPKFEVMEKPEGLVLVSFIPGMAMDDINVRYVKPVADPDCGFQQPLKAASVGFWPIRNSVSEDERGQFLLVQGRRLPSEGDTAILRQQIAIQKKM